MTDARGVTALLGYAIGTAQIVALEWFRSRTAHKRQLRLLRSELRRANTGMLRYNLSREKPPESDHIPRPPTVSARYVDVVSAIDFALTDEHRNDNSQESFLGLVDGLEILQGYRKKIETIIAANREEPDRQAALKRAEDLFDYAREYDVQLDNVEYQVLDSLRDITRRLKEVRLHRQIWRAIRPLPQGDNPRPLERGDERLKDLPAMRSRPDV